jgi:hypothetical protein
LEGLCGVEEVVLPKRQASAQREELKERLADGHAAPGSMPAQLGRDENAVPVIENFLGVEPNVLKGIEQHSPYLTDAPMTVIGGVWVREQLGGLILDGRIVASHQQVEVSAIRRRVVLANTTREDHAAEARVSRQSRPGRTQPMGKRREADEDSFIQAPVPPRFRYERDSDTSNGLDGLLRHRPRSIPQGQESA